MVSLEDQIEENQDPITPDIIIHEEAITSEPLGKDIFVGKKGDNTVVERVEILTI